MIILKKICISLLFLSVFVAQAADQDLILSFNRINDQNIEWYANKVKTELEHNALHKKVIIVGALAGLGYVTYQLLYGGQPSPIKPIAKIEVPQTDSIISQPLIDVIKPIEKKEPIYPQLTPDGVWFLNSEGATKRAKDNLSLIPWVYVWAKENFYTLVQQTAVLALFTGLNNSLGPISKYINALDGAADKFTARIFHAGNLAWFLKQHTQLSLLFTTLEYHAGKLENRPVVVTQTISLLSDQQHIKVNQDLVSLTQEEKIYHVQQLQRSWNIAVQQIEYVFGFMKFSSSQVKWYSLAALQAQSLQATMQHEFDTCAQILESNSDILLNNYEILYKKTLFESLQMLHMNIEQDLNAFADLEKLKSY